MRDKSPGKAHFSHAMQNTGQNQLMILHADYRGIINGEHESAPDRLYSILERGSNSPNLPTRYMIGAMALEGALKLTANTDERVEFLSAAKDNWDFVVDSSHRTGAVGNSLMRSELGLCTLRSELSLAMFEELPTEEVQSDMFDALVGLASQSETYYHSIFSKKHATKKDRRTEFSEISGFQAELATILLHQSHTLPNQALGQLALPSYYSEDHGMSHGLGSNRSHAWDVNLRESSEGEVEVIGKLQIKTRESAMRRHDKKQYADDIINIYLAEDMAKPKDIKKFRPGWILQDFVTIKEVEAGERAEFNRDHYYGAKHRIMTWSERLLDIIDERL